MERLFQELNLSTLPPSAHIRQVALLADMQAAAAYRLRQSGVMGRLTAALPENDYKIILNGFLGTLVCRMSQSRRPPDAPRVTMLAYRHVGTDPDDSHFIPTVFQNICDTTADGETLVYPGINPIDAQRVAHEVRVLECARLLGSLPNLSESCLSIEPVDRPITSG